MVMIVAVIVVMAVRVMSRAHARAQHGDADDHDEQSRGQIEPRVELLGEHVGRERERHQPEREDPGCASP